MSYNYRRNNYASKRMINNYKDRLWEIRQNIEKYTHAIVGYDNRIKCSFSYDEDDERKLNAIAEEVESYLRTILEAINLNSRYLTVKQIKYLCDIYEVKHGCDRIEYTHPDNIKRINRLWEKISDRLGII